MQRIIFYDGTCPMCNRAVRFLLAADQNKQFYFAPLNGETAKRKLKDLHLKNPNLDTLVLLEGEAILVEGKAVFRILWLLGGKYALIGWLSFLPSWLFDIMYRIIARYRYHLFSKKIEIKKADERFLP